MYKIDIFSVDRPFLSKIEKPLVLSLGDDSEFKEKGIIIPRQSCVLCQILRLVNTYKDINISRQTRYYLNIASEIQNYEDNIKQYKRTDKTVFTFGSMVVDYLYELATVQKGLNKVALKYILKRVIKFPDFIIYLDLDYNTIKAKTKQFARRYKVEVSMQGVGVQWRQRKTPEVLEEIKKEYGIPYVIISCVNKSYSQISKEILEKTKEFHISAGKML